MSYDNNNLSQEMLARRELDEVKKQLREANASIRSLERQKSKLEGDNERLSNSLDSANAKINNLNVDADADKAKIKELERELEKKNNEVETVKADRDFNRTVEVLKLVFGTIAGTIIAILGLKQRKIVSRIEGYVKWGDI